MVTMTAYRSLLFLCLAATLMTALAEPKTADGENELHKKNKTTTSAPITPTTMTTTTTTTSTTDASTTEPTTTTPHPPTPVTPVPPPKTGKWSFHEGNNTCIILQMAAQLNISYECTENKTMHSVFDVPDNLTSVTGGSCGDPLENITLSWNATKQMKNNITLYFKKNSTTGMFSLDTMVFEIMQDPVNFPLAKNANSTIILKHSNVFTVPLKKSFRCAKQQNIVMDSKAENNSTLMLKDLQIQAFHTEKGAVFDSANDCDMADVPDIVPIAVGCALGGLVLIMLISYLVARRRSFSRGYQSM